ncbi:MAG: collagen-like protein [Thermoleophilaceae bacterium]
MKRRPSPSLVISLVALLLAATGTATAAGVIKIKKPSQLGKNVVTSKALADGKAVGLRDLTKPARKKLAGKDGAPGPAGEPGGTGPQGDRGPKGDSPPALWGVVASNGALTQGNHAIASSRSGTGTFLVSFDQDVSGCAYLATIGPRDSAIATVAGEVTVTSGAAATDISVQTYAGDAANTPADRPFHLGVYC